MRKYIIIHVEKYDTIDLGEMVITFGGISPELERYVQIVAVQVDEDERPYAFDDGKYVRVMEAGEDWEEYLHEKGFSHDWYPYKEMGYFYPTREQAVDAFYEWAITIYMEAI